MKENYCNCLWCVWKPAQPEVNDRGLTCFNGSSFGSLINARSSSLWEIVQKYIFCLKILFFFLSTKWMGFLFGVFLKWREKTCQFPFSFTKPPNLIKKTPYWRAWCCASALPEFTSGPWSKLTHLQSQQFARISLPSLGCLESCGCSLKGQVPPGPEWLWRLCPAALIQWWSRSCCTPVSLELAGLRRGWAPFTTRM